MTPAVPWSLPPKDVVLEHDEVHVWRASLDRAASYVRDLEQTLTADERERAERFYFQIDREHFIAGRGLLRAVLSLYLNEAPDHLRFCYTSYGKPYLAEASGTDRLRFNVSHSRGLALYAVTRSRALGVDIEYLRPSFAGDGIAERFFSPAEVTALRALPAHQKLEAFFNCWTRKEAYIKARGEGLSFPLDQFDVALAPGEPAALLNTRGDPQEASRWSLLTLAPGPGYVAALCVEGHGWRLRCWQGP